VQVECFQQQVEPILYQYGVDMVYTGHTHAYEVSKIAHRLDIHGPALLIGPRNPS
jgi:predicted phosphodiesterase